MNVSDITSLYRYNDWANQRLLGYAILDPNLSARRPIIDEHI